MGEVLGFPRGAIRHPFTIGRLQGRFGFFIVDDRLLAVAPEAVRAVMGQCIVLGASHVTTEGCSYTLYHAISEQFDELPAEARSPFYWWRLGGPTPLAERLGGGHAA